MAYSASVVAEGCRCGFNPIIDLNASLVVNPVVVDLVVVDLVVLSEEPSGGEDRDAIGRE